MLSSSEEKKRWEEIKNRGANQHIYYNGYRVSPQVFQFGKVRIYYLEVEKPEEWVYIELLKY